MEQLVIPPYRTPHFTTLHHSRNDWAYIGANWPNYDLLIYISPPTSLCSKAVSGQPYYGHSVLKTYPCIPEISLVNNAYFQAQTAGCHQDYFRGQAYPIAARYHPDKCYYLTFDYASVTFRYIVFPLDLTIASHSFSPQLALNTWLKYRFTMWDFPSHNNPLKLAYKFELWETDHWTTYLEGVHSESIWATSAVNYYGTFLNYYGLYVGAGVKIDNTEIWTPAP
jgi:hypothetical protein